MVKTLISLITFTSLLLVLVACAHQNKTPPESAKKIPIVEGTHYAAVEFDEGKSTLDELDKRHLNALAQKAARDGREIEEIKILAWADEEYPAQNQKAAPAEIIVAKERANAIKEYLEDDLHSHEDIEAYNMAKRPHLLSKLFKDDEFTVKEAFEKSGTTATRLPSGKTSYTKASKALVIIEYKDQTI